MKEKTFKDLGIDEGDEYLKRVSLDYDLGEFGSLSNILDDEKKEVDDEEAKRKIKEIKDSV